MNTDSSIITKLLGATIAATFVLGIGAAAALPDSSTPIRSSVSWEDQARADAADGYRKSIKSTPSTVPTNAVVEEAVGDVAYELAYEVCHETLLDQPYDFRELLADAPSMQRQAVEVYVESFIESGDMAIYEDEAREGCRDGLESAL